MVNGSWNLTHGQQKKIAVDFEKDAEGKSPAGFTCNRSGRGEMGNWVVLKEKTAAAKNNVLAQTSMDKTGYRFPVCVYDGFSAEDVAVGVRFKPVKGTVDQAAGIVWRYKDVNNYYIVRANALENNVVLYKFEKGKRTDLPLKGKGRTYGVKCPVHVDKWSKLRVLVKGNHFEIYFNGEKLYEAVDNTHSGPGKVGLWTKADSYTLFDDFSFTALR
ncbi:MAG: DUF1080 domain-containing protein [bacterium]|nr:DUF1080 domain-containing protein [bacterium]